VAEDALRKAREAELRKNTYRVFRETPVYSCREIIEIVGREYRKAAGGARGWRSVEARRLQTVYETVRRILRRILALPGSDNLSTFHRELLEATIGLREYEEALRRVRRSLHLAKRFYGDYMVLVTTARDRREAARYRREGCGRILSLVRRLCRHLDTLRRARDEILKSHVVAEGLPVVTVAGAPNTGKSTLISRMSTAEPEVAPYPFTTKNIIVGKVEPRARSKPPYYMVDVPGLLDREPRSDAEKRALAAIKTLTDILLFLIDPTEAAVEPLEKQLDLLRRIRGVIGSEPLIIAVNKVDAATREEVVAALREAARVCRELGCLRVVAISALRGDNIEELRRVIEEEISGMVLNARHRAREP